MSSFSIPFKLENLGVFITFPKYIISQKEDESTHFCSFCAGSKISKSPLLLYILFITMRLVCYFFVLVFHIVYFLRRTIKSAHLWRWPEGFCYITLSMIFYVKLQLRQHCVLYHNASKKSSKQYVKKESNLREKIALNLLVIVHLTCDEYHSHHFWFQPVPY